MFFFFLKERAGLVFPPQERGQEGDSNHNENHDTESDRDKQQQTGSRNSNQTTKNDSNSKQRTKHAEQTPHQTATTNKEVPKLRSSLMLGSLQR